MRGNDSNEAAVTIRTLAARHNVSYVETTTDVWAHNVTRLAGDDIQLDEIELLLIALHRTGHLSRADALSLQVTYLRERRDLSRNGQACSSMIKGEGR